MSPLFLVLAYATIFASTSSLVYLLLPDFRRRAALARLDAAEGMTQGMMMCAVPPVLIITFYFLDPSLVRPLFTTFLGILMLLVVAAMDAMGMWMIMNTVKIDV